MHVHSSEGDVNKMHQNLVTIVVMTYTLSKLHVDIKVNIFNMKVKNHLFSLTLYMYKIQYRIISRY